MWVTIRSININATDAPIELAFQTGDKIISKIYGVESPSWNVLCKMLWSCETMAHCITDNDELITELP